MTNLNADIRPALRYVRLNISETQSSLNGTLNDFVSGNNTIDTSMQGQLERENQKLHNQNTYKVEESLVIDHRTISNFSLNYD